MGHRQLEFMVKTLYLFPSGDICKKVRIIVVKEYNYLCGVMASTSPISNLHKHQANIYIQGEQRFTEFAVNSLQIKSYSVLFIPYKLNYNRNKINQGNVKTSAGLYCFFLPLLYCPGCSFDTGQ